MELQKKYNTVLRAFQLKDNLGHGIARRRSISLANNEIIALMDADDISLPNRFITQIPFLSLGYDVVGGQISEFANNPNDINSFRNVELTDKEIKKDLKKRCPFNQVSIAFKKSAYNKAGGYLDFYCNEDYYLWIRMFLSGAKFLNVPEVIVNVNTGEQMVSRRSGIKYFKSEKRIQKILLKNRIISFPRYLYNVFKRFIGELIISNLFPKLFIVLAHSKNNKFRNSTSNHSQKQMAKIDKFSVCMCVYNGDDHLKFERSLKSILNQELMPDEIVLVIDGPINSNLLSVVEKYFSNIEKLL